MGCTVAYPPQSTHYDGDWACTHTISVIIDFILTQTLSGQQLLMLSRCGLRCSQFCLPWHREVHGGRIHREGGSLGDIVSYVTTNVGEVRLGQCPLEEPTA